MWALAWDFSLKNRQVSYELLTKPVAHFKVCSYVFYRALSDIKKNELATRDFHSGQEDLIPLATRIDHWLCEESVKGPVTTMC